MRNHLAEEVLSKKMLYLLQAYKKNCSQTQGHEATYLDKTIEFIDMTSKIVNIFDDRRPVSSLDDHRLATNHEVLDYLNRWEKDAEAHTELSKAERAKRLVRQTSI